MSLRDAAPGCRPTSKRRPLDAEPERVCAAARRCAVRQIGAGDAWRLGAISVLCPLAVALALKLVFRARTWWLGALVVTRCRRGSCMPHRLRNGAGGVVLRAFCAPTCCIAASGRVWLPLALVFGAAIFYSYANGQGVMLAVACCCSLRPAYHLRQSWRTLLTAALRLRCWRRPTCAFGRCTPEAVAYHLQTLDSYWLKPLPLGQKLLLFGQTYLHGLSPFYWFPPNDTDLVRHQMKGMGHLSVLALPFVLIGLGACLWRWRRPEYRAVLAAALAAPFSASLVAILVPRVLFDRRRRR